MTLCGVLGGRRLQFPCGFMLALYVGTTVRFHFGSTIGFHFISILVFLSKRSVHECPTYSPEKMMASEGAYIEYAWFHLRFCASK